MRLGLFKENIKILIAYFFSFQLVGGVVLCLGMTEEHEINVISTSRFTVSEIW